MSTDSFQDSLFDDPIGLRFRHTREKQRLSLESVAQQVKLPVAILEAIEREDWARLGAPIFVRSYVGSYAKFLGLPAVLADDVVRGKPVPALVSVGAPTSQRNFDRGVMRLAYVAMTVVILGSVIALAMYFQGPRRNAEALPPDATATYAAGAIAPLETGAADAPVTASLAPALPQDPAAAAPGALPAADAAAAGNAAAATAVAGGAVVLRFHGDSWVDIVDRQGAHIERGLVPAGTVRSYADGQLAEVTLGDSTAVEVSAGGIAVDLAPFREAKVAHFTVSSAGRIGAPGSD